MILRITLSYLISFLHLYFNYIVVLVLHGKDAFIFIFLINFECPHCKKKINIWGNGCANCSSGLSLYFAHTYQNVTLNSIEMQKLCGS